MGGREEFDLHDRCVEGESLTAMTARWGGEFDRQDRWVGVESLTAMTAGWEGRV